MWTETMRDGDDDDDNDDNEGLTMRLGARGA